MLNYPIILKLTCVFNNKLTYISTYFKREQEKKLITVEVWWARRYYKGKQSADCEDCQSQNCL